MTLNIFLSFFRSTLWGRSLFLGTATCVLTLFCLLLGKAGGHISPLWFATTVMTVVTFRLPLKMLPLPLGCCMIGLVGANILIYKCSFISVEFALINLLHALTGGLLLRRVLDHHAPIESLASWVKMAIIAGLLLPLLSGVVASQLVNVSADRDFFSVWVMSEVIGMLALGPVCLLWQADNFAKNFNCSMLPETLLTLSITLILTYVSLRLLPLPFTLVIIVLFYSAVRLPRFEAFIIFLLAVTMMTAMLALDQLDHLTTTSGFMIRAPWLPFLMSLIPGHIMALVMHSFHKEKRRIQESENRFRQALEYSAIGMALVALNGQWLQVNKALCKLLGYTQEELSTLTFQVLTHPDDLHSDLASLNALLAGDITSYTMEKRYFNKNQQIVWALLAVSLVRDSEHQPLYLIKQIENITSLKKSEDERRDLMQRITLANEAGGIGVWDWDLQSGRMRWDNRMFEIYDLVNDGKITYLTWVNSLLPDDRQMAIDAFDNAIKNATSVDVQFRITTGKGIRHIRSQSMLVRNEQGDIEHMLGINQDVTTMQRLAEALYQEKERMHITLDAIGEAVISTDRDMRVTFMNPVAESMTGWTQEQAEGQAVDSILHITQGMEGPRVENLLLCSLPHEKAAAEIERETVLHSTNGEIFDIHYSIMPLKTQAGENIGCVLVIRDVSESREMMRRLSYSASHDMLTHLPNRVYFDQQLRQMLISASEQHLQHALAFIDLDRFKAVNDTAGHAAGDALLREVSAVMKSHLRNTDFLARLGGDEFGVLLHGCPAEKASEIIAHIIDAVNNYRLHWEGHVYRVGASAGITLFDKSNLSASAILAQADLACYKAKHGGRGQLSLFETQLVSDFKPPLSRRDNGSILAQQPLQLLVSPVAPPRKIQAASLYLAEMQFSDLQGEEIDETSFRKGLQDNALVLALDHKLINEFFLHYAPGVMDKALSLVLPISPQGLGNTPLINEIIAHIAHCALPPQLLYFSVGVEALLNNLAVFQPQIARLRQAGCGIVLNGIGRNLEVFDRLPGQFIDYMVLNPMLTANVHCNLMDEMMVSIVHGHAQRMRIQSIAGPVTLPVALSALADIGIDQVWGEAVAHPVPLAALLNESYFAIK